MHLSTLTEPYKKLLVTEQLYNFGVVHQVCHPRGGGE